MAKVKYYYDSDTLSYRKIELRKRDKFRRMFVFVMASVVMGGLLVFLMYQFVESPRQKVMKRELENMKLHYELLEKKMTQAEDVLDGIQKGITIFIELILKPIRFRRSKEKQVLGESIVINQLRDLIILK